MILKHNEKIICKKEGYRDIYVRRIKNLWFDCYEWADNFHQYYGWNWKKIPMTNELIEANIDKYGVDNANRNSD